MRRRYLRTTTTIFAVPALLVAAGAWADNEVSLDELLAGWGVDIEQTSVSVDTLEPGLHVMRRAGGAVVASIGEDGVLLVDDQFDATVRSLQSAIHDLGGGDIDIVVNTHAHFDHADGNPALGESGATIVAQNNARQRMITGMHLDYVDRYYVQPPYPQAGLPVITFPDRMTLHYNGQTIDLFHFGNGHTDGDAVVYFREANVVHVGDLYTAPWPYIDAGNGGSLAGLVSVARALIDEIDDDTRIVSGHRPVASRADLTAYADRLAEAHIRLAALARDGRTLDDVIALDPLAGLDDSGAPSGMFLALAYQTVLAETTP